MFRSRDRQFTSHACAFGRRWMYVSHKRKNKMKTVVSVVLLTAVFLDLSAQSFTIRGCFIDVANDTLSIGYVQREPEKRVVDVDVFHGLLGQLVGDGPPLQEKGALHPWRLLGSSWRKALTREVSPRLICTANCSLVSWQ